MRGLSAWNAVYFEEEVIISIEKEANLFVSDSPCCCLLGCELFIRKAEKSAEIFGNVCSLQLEEVSCCVLSMDLRCLQSAV